MIVVGVHRLKNNNYLHPQQVAGTPCGTVSPRRSHSAPRRPEVCVVGARTQTQSSVNTNTHIPLQCGLACRTATVVAPLLKRVVLTSKTFQSPVSALS